MKILVIVLALALVIGCGTTVSVENPVSSPDTECKKYIDIADAIVKRNDALEAYGRYTEYGQNEEEEAEFDREASWGERYERALFKYNYDEAKANYEALLSAAGIADEEALKEALKGCY